MLHTELYSISQLINSRMGPGHSEFIYHRAFEAELRANNIRYETEKRVTISYTDTKGITHTLADERIDLYVYTDSYQIILELKAVVNSPRECEISQVYKYYNELKKLSKTVPKYGIVINFPQAGTKEPRSDIDFVELDLENRIKLNNHIASNNEIQINLD
jgi:GxxExxY protein